MASGRPIIAVAPIESDLAHLINDNKIGIVVAPGDSSSLRDAIELLRNDPNRCARMGQAARQTLLADYSRSQVISRYVNTFSNLVSQSSER